MGIARVYILQNPDTGLFFNHSGWFEDLQNATFFNDLQFAKKTQETWNICKLDILSIRITTENAIRI